jgi:hypothetical protein
MYIFQKGSIELNDLSKGLVAKDDEHFNYIGLGQLDLNNGDAAAVKLNSK